MLALFGNRLAPLTYSIGFLDVPPKKVAQAMARFFRRVHHDGKATQLTGSLEDNLLQLQPLVIASRPRILLTSTALEGWTAMFDGDAHGQGVGQLASHMARELKARGCFVAIAPPAAATGNKSLGGRQFHVLGPEQQLGYVRTIDLIENFPGRWEFETTGQPQPYEDLQAYTKRRRTDRLTEQMLTNYTATLGLHPWQEDFYHNPSYLITNGETIRYPATLTQARTRLGLTN